MTQQQETSRRSFRPKNQFAMPLAVAAAVILSPLTVAGQSPATSNETQVIDLGVKPDVTGGPIVIFKSESAYLTFNATQLNEEGGAIGDGLAIIQLEGCSSWDFRTPGDEELAPHPVDIEALDLCETFEVAGSDWADGTASERHFIFTFVGFTPGVSIGVPHFECVARNATAHFVTTDSFDDVLMYIDYLEMEDPPPTEDAEPSPSDDPGDYDPGADNPESYDPESYDPGAYDSGSYDPGAYDPGSYE